MNIFDTPCIIWRYFYQPAFLCIPKNPNPYFDLKANIASFVFNVCFIFLYLNAKGFIQKKSKDKQKLPAIYGRYQRNIITYKQSVLLAFLIIFHNISLHAFEYLSPTIEIDTRRLFLSSNFIYNIFHCVLFPLYILKTIPNYIPDFFTNQSISKENKTFYVIPPTIAPRRYNFINQKQDSNRRFNLYMMKQISVDYKNELIVNARNLRKRACELPSIAE